MSKRTFTLILKNGKESGIYKSSTPGGAASKAFTQMLKGKKMTGGKRTDFKIREQTQGSKKKTYSYSGKRTKLNKPVQLGDYQIKYKNIIKSLNK